MARTAMTMSSGGQIAEHLSVGILARSYPRERIRAILERTGMQATKGQRADALAFRGEAVR
jgi:hypothetical protein